MKSYLPATQRTPMVLLILALLVISCLSGGVASAAPQFSMDCESCHRMPPLDSTDGKRNPDSGAVVGNHETHAANTPSSCAICHGPGVLASIGHRDKTIQVNGNINNSPASASYTRSAGVFINQTTIPPLGSCSNVNCHFETKTAVWGSAKYQRPQDDPSVCGACHGSSSYAAPADGNHPNASVAGQKHAAYYGTGAASCAKCHPDHAAEALPFAHATSATEGGRSLAVSFNTFPNSGGSYSKSENLSYPNYLPSRTPAGMRNGSCSGTYCHSDGAGTTATATWGGTLDCSGCHGYDSTSAKPMTKYPHNLHIINAPKVGRIIGCQECHSATTTDGITVNIANHVDGNVNIKFDNAINKDGELPAYNGQPTTGPAGVTKAPLTPPASCSNVYCHSVGNLDASGNVVNGAQGSGSGFLNIAWDAGVIHCDGCHGDQNGKAHPVYQSGAAGSVTANSHVKHVEGRAYGCDFCHYGTTQDAAIPPTSVTAGGTHLNRVENVDFKSFGAQTGSYDNRDGVKSCSATYCHSSGEATPAPALVTAQWGGGKLDCRGCHGGDADHDNPIVTGRHGKHINAAKSAGAATQFICAECHAQTVSFVNNTTISDQSRHVNTLRDYSGARAGRISTFFTEQTCGNTYCHSSGQESPVFRNMTGSKGWGSNASIGCDGCHGYSDGAFKPVAGEPNYPNAPGAANSHQKHTLGSNMTDSTGCALCHRTTVDQSVKNKLKSYSSAHLNGVRDVTFQPLGNMTGHYLAGSKSCANTYCHGSGTSVAWGSTQPLLCTDCHRADSTLAGAHGSHWQSATPATSYTATPGNLTGTATSYNFECSSCHNGAHAKGPTTKGNAAEVFFNYTAAGLSGEYSYGDLTAMEGSLQWSNGTCSLTYCHSRGDGSRSEGIQSGSITWATPAKTLRCDGCHGGDVSQTNAINSGMHRNHIDTTFNVSLGEGNGLRCADCHSRTTGFASNTTLIDKRYHVNKFKDYTGAFAGGSGNLQGVNRTCASIYCHSNGKVGTGAQQYRNPSWIGGSAMGCNGCHGSVPELGTPNYPNGGVGSPTANSHNLHVQKMGITTANACYVCHARTVDKYSAQPKMRPYSTAHLKGSNDVTFGSMTTSGFQLLSSVRKAFYEKGSQSCSNVSCHSNGRGGYQSVRWGDTSNCAMCHALNKLSRGHIFHVYTSAMNNPTFYDNYTANRSNSAQAPGRYNYGCANCHPVVNPDHMKGKVLIDLYPGDMNSVGRLRSLNGKEITASAVVAGTSGSGTSGTPGVSITCNNVYCHSNGFSEKLVYQQTPEWYSGSFTADDRCANCHGNSPNSDPVAMPGSPTHLNQNWLATNTTGGHIIGIHSNNIVNGVNFNGYLQPGSVEPASHGVAASSTTISCNVCHYDTVQTGANFGSAQCRSCHTGAGAAYATIADKSKHITGSPRVSIQPNLIIRSKAQVRDQVFMSFSGPVNSWTRNNGYKLTNSYDSSKQPLSMNYTGGTCSNVICHFNKPVQWKVLPGSVTCDSCHQSM